MSELVTITPIAGFDSNGDPLSNGAPFMLPVLEVAPGNTLQRFGVGGDLDVVDFTVFLPLRVRVADAFVATAAALTEDFWIEVRDRKCRGRLQEWNSGGRGGVAVLAHSATGKSA